MTKIRIMALPKKIDKIVEVLEKEFEVISVSKPYENRNSKEVRVYVEIEGEKDENI